MVKKKVSKKKTSEKIVKKEAVIKKVVKKEAVSKKVVKKEAEEKNFVVIYNGVAGRKAVSLNSAVTIAEEYIKDKKCKKAYVYELVKKVE